MRRLLAVMVSALAVAELAAAEIPPMANDPVALADDLVAADSAPPVSETAQSGSSEGDDVLKVSTRDFGVASTALVAAFQPRRIPLTFASGSAILTARARAYLDSFAARLNQASYKAQRMLFISGHTDRSGSAATNLALSKARAGSVASYLRAKLPARSLQIKEDGFGFMCPLPDKNPNSPLNRRVEIDLRKPNC